MNALNILVVEDEGLIAWDLKKQLTNAGYQVIGPYNNGKEALSVFGTMPIDLVLLDIHIQGDLDGIEVAAAIRQTSQIPLVFLTAMATKEYIERAKQVQPSAYLLKPYQTHALHIAIEMAFSNFEAQKTALSPNLPYAEENSKPSRDVFLIQQGFAIIKPQKVFLKIKIQDILYLEADHVYTKVVTASQVYLLRSPLQKILEKLQPFSFQKIHRSFGVNMSIIERFDEENVYIGNQMLPIGNSHKGEFLRYFWGKG